MAGRPGRNVAWDYVLEKMNLSFKTSLCGTITEERLNDFGVTINALKHTRKQFEQAWRHGAGDPDDEDAPGEYSHVETGDVKVLVDALKAHLGGGKDEAGDKAAAFAKAKRTNPFAAIQRLRLPWNKIAKKGMKNLRAHCISSRASLRRSTRGRPDCAPCSAGGGSGCCEVVPRSERILLLDSRSTTVVAVPSLTRATVHFHRPTKS